MGTRRPYIISNELSAGSIVVDLGANLGRFSHGMIARFGCRCYAVEANPSLCERIEFHPRLEIINAAVAGQAGTVSLHLSHNSEASSLFKSAMAGQAGMIEVNALTLQDVLRRIDASRVDLLKIDIEGAEISVLESCPDAVLQAIPQITVEFHDFLGITPRPVVEQVVRRMERCGFAWISMWRNAYGDTLFINRRLTSVGVVQRLWMRHVVRNWRGLARVARRALVGHRSPIASSLS